MIKKILIFTLLLSSCKTKYNSSINSLETLKPIELTDSTKRPLNLITGVKTNLTKAQVRRENRRTYKLNKKIINTNYKLEKQEIKTTKEIEIKKDNNKVKTETTLNKQDNRLKLLKLVIYILSSFILLALIIIFVYFKKIFKNN